ncbi:spore germination protein [Caldalkalibacillus salinus]|uniref:spore germination protein n=1 Tax=Caldalkalibacillus salinus TaxID=2803787 RepID=UPI001924B404
MSRFEALNQIKQALEPNDDVIFQSIKFQTDMGYLVYIPELVDDALVREIQRYLPLISQNQSQETDIRDALSTQFAVTFLDSHDNQAYVNNVVQALFIGHTVLMLPEFNLTCYFQTEKMEGRLITEPQAEQMVRGPREGFVENIHTNLMLVRKKLKSPQLKVQYLSIGRDTQTTLAIVYLEGTAKSDIVNEVRKRLESIDVDGVVSSREIEEMIQDHPFSPFPTMMNTERPDSVVSSLLEGKVAIMTDGSPFTIMGPTVFFEFFSTSQDYYNQSFSSTCMRLLRILGLFVAVSIPAFYIALIAVHQDLLQTPFLLQIAARRIDLPYPVSVETFFMILTFELIRSAGTRMPASIGNTLGPIIGLVLIGFAGIYGGLVGPLTVVVVGVAGITFYILPNYTFRQSIRFLNIPFILVASVFGFMGILVAWLFILIHLISLRSFGTPYMTPLSPTRKEGWKDLFVRAPKWAINTRLPGVSNGGTKRANASKTTPPKNPEEGH